MMLPHVIDYLANSQHETGGWGYRTGHRPVVEATAVVLLAIRDEPSAKDLSTRGMGWLLHCQHEDGGWGINEEDSESGWQTAWALITMKKTVQDTDRIEKAADWLKFVATYAVSREEFLGIELPKQDSLDALVWPWLPGQAGWLEPTALAVLALNNSTDTPQVDSRIKTALDYFNRYRTPSGGWNIGNTGPLDTIVIPRAYHTALVLLALADVARQNIQSGDLNALQQDLQRDPGMLAHAAGLLAVKILGISDDSNHAYLSGNQLSDGSWEHSPFVTAWTILGMRGYI